MPLGDNPYAVVARDVARVIKQHGQTATVTRTTSTTYSPLGDAQPTQTASTVTFVLVRDEPNEQQTLAGAKPVEILEGLVPVGSVRQNDQITWNGLLYLVLGIYPYDMGGVHDADLFHAEREVKPS